MENSYFNDKFFPVGFFASDFFPDAPSIDFIEPYASNDRTYSVLPENRIYCIPYENRIYSIKGDR